MASIQRFTAKGWRLFWKLYFPNGTTREKSKTSKSRDKLEEMLPDIARIEKLSQRNELVLQDIMFAYNLKLISRDEVVALKWAIKRKKTKWKKTEIFRELTTQLCSVIDDVSKIKERLEEYLREAEPEDYLRENVIAIGQRMKDEWSQWKKRFLPSKYPDPPPGIIRPTHGGIGVPRTSGIYFVWENGNIVYVGQSINMANRVRLDHQQIFETDLLSFVPFENDGLPWAECYYIGILKPKRNFKPYARPISLREQSVITSTQKSIESVANCS